FGLVAFVLVANGQLLIGSAAATWRRRRHGLHVPSGSSQPGLVVHLGLAVMAAGIIASSAFAQQSELTLRSGHTASFADYDVRYDGMQTDRQPQRVVLPAPVTVTRESGQTDVLTPRLNLYPAASEPIGSPSIKRGVVWDLYVSVIGLQDNGD